MKNVEYGSIGYIVLCCLSFFAMHWYGLEGDYVTAITTAGVGYVAYFVYIQGKKTTLQDTAKMLILDIRNAEDALEAVRSGPSAITWARLAVAENNWSKYKQHFVGHLNTDEFRQFEQFFHIWLEIVKLKTESGAFALQGMAAKASEAQILLANLDRDATDFAERRAKIIKSVNEETWIFEPDTFLQRLEFYLRTVQALSGSTGFAKIRAIAGFSE